MYVHVYVTAISCIQTSVTGISKMQYNAQHSNTFLILINLYCCSGFLQQYLTLSRMYSYQLEAWPDPLPIRSVEKKGSGDKCGCLPCQ